MLLALLLPLLAIAQDCPEGYALAKGADFTAVVHSTTTGDKKYHYCPVKGDAIAAQPLKILGCNTFVDAPMQLMLKTPSDWTHPCFDGPQKAFRATAKDFTVRASKSEFTPKVAAVDCPPDKKPETLDPREVDSFRSLTTIIESDQAESHGFKTVAELDKYHSCLLSSGTKKTQQENYAEKYRFLIEKATGSFGVPMALITCLCGRESMFSAQAASFTSVTGICQNTKANLKDVQSWISDDGSDAQADWKTYVRNLGSKIEDKSCKTAKLTPELISQCPSLGFGAAALYLRYTYTRIEGKGINDDVSWEGKSRETMETLGAAYNVGVGRALSLRKKDRALWTGEILKETCEKDSPAKFEEVKAHIIALHSCLMPDNWLDHQGKPMRGECEADNTAASVAKQKARFNKFVASLPGSCGKKKIKANKKAKAAKNAAVPAAGPT